MEKRNTREVPKFVIRDSPSDLDADVQQDFPKNKNTNAGPDKPNGKGGLKKSATSGSGSRDEETETIDVEEFIRKMVNSAQHRLMRDEDDVRALDLDDIRRLITDAQIEAGPRDVSDLSIASTDMPFFDSDGSDVSPRSKDLKPKKKKVKKKRFDPVHERRVLYRPSPFLTYIKPDDYVCMPSVRNLPSYIHNALPFPWGVRLPLPKSQRNSPDLPVCSPLPLFPPENIIAFSYQHSSKHYQICADSKAEQKLEWL